MPERNKNGYKHWKIKDGLKQYFRRTTDQCNGDGPLSYNFDSTQMID